MITKKEKKIKRQAARDTQLTLFVVPPTHNKSNPVI